MGPISRNRRFESLEPRQMLTRVLAVADAQPIFASAAGFSLADYQFADLDGDLVAELVVLQQAKDQASSRVTVLDQDELGLLHEIANLSVDFRATDLILAAANDGSGEMGLRQAHDRLMLVPFVFGSPSFQFGTARPFRATDLPAVNAQDDVWQIADLNRDDLPDIVISQIQTGVGVTDTFVYLATAQGSFESPVRYQNGQHLADVNHDGLLDLLVVSSSTTNTIEMLLNDGSGVFERTATTTPSNQRVAQLRTADLNRDDLLDIVTVSSLGVEVRHGNGDGTFAAQELILAAAVDAIGGSGTIDGVDFYDVDGDGRQDILVGPEFVPHGGVTPPRILFANDQGFEVFSLSESWLLPTPVNYSGDARAEFLQRDDQGLSVIRQVDPRSLETSFLDRANIARQFVSTNEDAIPDVLLVAPKLVALLESNGQGGYVELTFDLGIQEGLDSVSGVYQLDELGLHNAIVVIGRSNEDWFLISLRSQLGAWQSETMALPSAVTGEPTVGDFDGNGFEDLVIAMGTEQRTFMFYGNTGQDFVPTTLFSYATSTANPDVRPLLDRVNKVGDLDGDGRVDLVVTDRDADGQAFVRVALHRRETNWLIFEPFVIESLFSQIDLLDMNQDGRLDLVEQSTSGRQLHVGIMEADGTWDRWLPLPVGSGGTFTGTAEDFHQDGRLDLVIASWHTEDNQFLRKVSIYDYDPSSGWQAPSILLDSSVSYLYSAVDFDTDGDLDLLIEPDRYACSSEKPSSCRDIVLYRNDGLGQFSQHNLGPPQPRPDFSQEVDVNGDGKPELVSIAGPTTIYRSVNGQWIAVASIDEVLPIEMPDEFVASATDVDGDSILDLVYTFRGGLFTNASYQVRFGAGDLQFGPAFPLLGNRFDSDGLVVEASQFGTTISVLQRTENHVDWESIMLGRSVGRADKFQLTDVDGDGDRDFVLLHDDGVSVVSREEAGDFNRDRLVTAADVDLLHASLGAQDRESLGRFDMNYDHVIDQQDVDFWVTHAAHTKRGDTNLDGKIDFADFLVISANFGKAADSWTDADFDGDGRVSFSDFLDLSVGFGFDRDRRSLAV